MKTLLIISLLLALGGGSSAAQAKTTITGTAPAEVKAKQSGDGSSWGFPLPDIKILIQTTDNPGPSFFITSSGDGTLRFPISDVLVQSRSGVDCQIFTACLLPPLAAELKIAGRFSGPAATRGHHVQIPAPGEYDIILTFTGKDPQGRNFQVKTPPMRVVAKASDK